MLPFHATNKKIGLYQPWLAAGGNRKMAPVRNFLQKLFMHLQWFLYSKSFFTFVIPAIPLKKLVLIKKSLTFKRYV